MRRKPLLLASLFSAYLVVSPAIAGSVSEIIFHCAACHGAEGIAKSADVPHLAGQQELYLLNQLKAFRSGKRPHKEMRYLSRRLTDDEMAEITRYYASMKR